MADYGKMTVAKLKEELTSRGVDFAGCKLKADYVAKLEADDGGAPKSSPKSSPKNSPKNSPKKSPKAAPAADPEAAAKAAAKAAEAAEIAAMKAEQKRNADIEKQERQQILQDLAAKKAAETAEVNKSANEAAARKAKAAQDKAAAELKAAKAKAAAEAEAAAKAEANKKLLESAAGEEDDMEEDAPEEKKKMSKYLLNKNKKKKKKKAEKKEEAKAEDAKPKEGEPAPAAASNIEIEYVTGQDAMEDSFDAFQSVFARYMPQEEEAVDDPEAPVAAAAAAAADDSDDEDAKNKLSKKKRKLLNRLSVAELKQLVKRPEVVEVHDVTGSDPRLLIHLKSYRNTVAVPRHWCQKRKYLQGKRGIDKAPFELPQYIADTGITGIRESVTAKDDDKKLKQKSREKLQPKMGKMDIDYQVLHDAFFRYQTKPSMTGPGDLYYEGKEFEIHLREKKPGELSEDLKTALGMQDGGPPPWLINMQRYGPPPSFPNLKIAGLNAPIPEGTSYGYHPGGWGKPPVDEYGRPLYGDVFGAGASDGIDYHKIEVERLKTAGHWGELEEEEEEEEDDDDEEDEEEDISGDEEDVDMGGAESVQSTLDSGATSVVSGMETPESLDLRKPGTGESTPSEAPKQLYQVISQTEGAKGGFMASAHGYDMSGAVANVAADPMGLARAKVDARDKLGLATKGNQAVDVALNPEQLETLDEEGLKAMYAAQQQANKVQSQGEDYSDILEEGNQKRRAANDAQQKNAKKARGGDDGFKF